MNTKKIRKFKNIQPTFKVKITKRQEISMLKVMRNNSLSAVKHPELQTNYICKPNRITTFLAKIPNMKIPSPPQSLLERIEEEKLKLEGYGIGGLATQWSLPLLWDNDELLLSITNDLLNSIYTKPASKASSTRPLNSFMAFRVYNAQFGYGLRQNILSSLLASAWHSNPEQQNIWDTFAQQFNFVKPKCGFVEWVDQRYERES